MARMENNGSGLGRRFKENSNIGRVWSDLERSGMEESVVFSFLLSILRNRTGGDINTVDVIFSK